MLNIFARSLVRLLAPHAVAAVLAMAWGGAASAQTYPTKAITFVVPFTAGAGPDVFVRAIARAIAQETGVPTLVENKPGAGSVLAAQTVARAAADGHTVLVTGNVAFTGNPYVFKKLPYDPVADFTPVTTLAKGPMYLYVNAQKLPVHSVDELLRLLRKDPHKYTFGYTSITGRLPAEVLQQTQRVQLLAVPYRSGAAATPDLVSGQIDMMFTDYSAWTHVASGRLRAIGVTDLQRSAFAPALPTFEEAGVKGMDIGFWLAAYLPARAPAAVVAQLHRLLAQAVKTQEVKTAYQAWGTSEYLLPLGGLAKFQAQESAAWGRIIHAAGIQPE
jgi:tripartite-type tricarboxylate transporter receptor subunit TctC